MARLNELKEANANEAAEAAGRGRAPLASQLRSRGAQLRAAAELVDAGDLEKARALLGELEAEAPPQKPPTPPQKPPTPPPRVEPELAVPAAPSLGVRRGLRELELALSVPPTPLSVRRQGSAAPTASFVGAVGSAVGAASDGEAEGGAPDAAQQTALLDEAEQRREAARQMRAVLRSLRSDPTNPLLQARLQRIMEDADEAAGAAEDAVGAVVGASSGASGLNTPMLGRSPSAAAVLERAPGSAAAL